MNKRNSNWKPANVTHLTNAKPTQTLAEWWEEDAQRLNELCNAFAKAGTAVPVPDMDDELDEEGTIVE